jgi:hypothetical protein
MCNSKKVFYYLALPFLTQLLRNSFQLLIFYSSGKNFFTIWAFQEFFRQTRLLHYCFFAREHLDGAVPYKTEFVAYRQLYFVDSKKIVEYEAVIDQIFFFKKFSDELIIVRLFYILKRQLISELDWLPYILQFSLCYELNSNIKLKHERLFQLWIPFFRVTLALLRTVLQSKLIGNFTMNFYLNSVLLF